MSVEGSTTQTSELANARDSTRAKRDGDLNEIDELNLRHRKHDDPRIIV
jgi:hypothetical protein